MCQNAYGVKAEGFLTLYEYKASNGKIYKIGLKMPGTYQVKNSITAIEAALALENQGFKVEENIEKGLLNANWPGRMEVINDSPLFIICLLYTSSDRDTWKLENWDEYVKKLDFSVPTGIKNIFLFDNSSDDKFKVSIKEAVKYFEELK